MWLTLSPQQALASLRQSQRDSWAFLGVTSVRVAAQNVGYWGSWGVKLDTSGPWGDRIPFTFA